MKFMISFLIAVLPVASVAQSQSGHAPGASGVALPKTTEVMVILTAKQGVTRQQIIAKYIPVGPLMPLMALMGTGAQNP